MVRISRDRFWCVVLTTLVLLIITGVMITNAQQEEREEPDEKWIIVEQPRCCSDCSYVSRGFKCKLKSCLTKCPFPPKSTTTIEPTTINTEIPFDGTSTPTTSEGESFS